MRSRQIALCLGMSLPVLAWGHAQLLVEPPPHQADRTEAAFNSPPPREDSVRMKDILPCGGMRGEQPASVKGKPVQTYERGSTITVHWKETNDHTGVWRIDISADEEQTWRTLLLLNDGVDEFVGVKELSEELPDYSWAEVTLPADLTCANCTFRLTQSMGPIDDGNDYYSCADITVK